MINWSGSKTCYYVFENRRNVFLVKSAAFPLKKKQKIKKTICLWGNNLKQKQQTENRKVIKL